MAEKDKEKRKDRLLGGVFLGTVTGASILFGFGTTLAMAKKKDPKFFLKGMQAVGNNVNVETGGSLALRALGWGSLYAVSGFSLFCFTVWKAVGVNNMEEFRHKVGSILPRIPKKEPQGRTEFSSVRELFNYIIEEDKKEK